MSSWVVVQLDTTAPSITWGPVTDANAGEEMSVEYLISADGEVTSAELELLDSRILPMTVAAGTLSVLLPADAPQGAATVRAFVVDDVLNEGTEELVVAISGVIAPVEPSRAQGHPPVAPVTRHRHRTRRRARATYTTSVLSTSTGRARVRVRYTTPRESRSFRETVRLASHYSLAASFSTAASASVEVTASIQRRPEGPNAEDELIFLDIL